MAPGWKVDWACPVDKVRHVTSRWAGTRHIFLALTPQGEPGADGAAGKEVSSCWACGGAAACPSPRPDPSLFIHEQFCVRRLSLGR